MNKIYIAKYSVGSYDDYHIIDVFTSISKEKVEKWVNKFNSKLEYWQNHFSKYSTNWSKSCLKDEYLHVINADRFWQIMDCNEAFLVELELRK